MFEHQATGVSKEINAGVDNHSHCATTKTSMAAPSQTALIPNDTRGKSCEEKEEEDDEFDSNINSSDKQECSDSCTR